MTSIYERLQALQINLPGDGAIYESLWGWTLLLRPNSVTAG